MGALMIEGWALYWNTVRRDRRTRIARGAFDAFLHEQAAVPILLGHDEDLELGAVRALSQGPYSLSALLRGLRFTLQLQPGPVANALERAAQRRQLTGCSVCLELGYQTRTDRLPDGPVETITRAGLREISILTGSRPAYPSTSLRVWRVGSSLGWASDAAQTASLVNQLRAVA